MASFDPQADLSNNNFPQTPTQLLAHVNAHTDGYIELLTNYTQIVAEHNSLSNERDVLSQQIFTLQQQVSSLTQQLNSVPVASLNHNNHSNGYDKALSDLAKLKNPDPEKYDGDRTALDTFTSQLRIKLRELSSNLERIDITILTPDQKLAKKLDYCFGFLKGHAAKVMQNFYASDTCTLPDTEAFFRNLTSFFGDPMAKDNAMRELIGLQQKNTLFPEYHAKWIYLVAKAGKSPESEFDRFKFTISIELTTALRGDTDVYNDYQKFVDRCNLLDSQIRSVQSRERSLQNRLVNNTTTQTPQQRTFQPQFTTNQNQNQATSLPFSRPQNNAPRSFVPPQPPPPNTFRLNYQTSQGFGNSLRNPIPAPQFGRPAFGQSTFSRSQGDHIHLDYAATNPSYNPTTHNPDGTVSTIERARRRNNNLCNVCGESGHYKANCPNSREARVSRLNGISV